MKVGFDAKRAFTNSTGLGNYARTLIEGLNEFAEEIELVAYSSKAGKKWPTRPTRIKVVHPEGLFRLLPSSFWRTTRIAGLCKREGIEIYHGLSAELPSKISQVKGLKTVVTIHDTLFKTRPEWYKSIDAAIYEKKTHYACEVADLIIAISKKTKDDLVNHFAVNPKKIKVVYQSCNPIFYAELFKPSPLKSPYFVYVGGHNPRKNLDGMLKAWTHFAGGDYKLVMIGIGQDSEKINALPEGMKKSIILPGQISDYTLKQYYDNCLSVIYPSFDEGFGIPVVEALACKKPIILSNIAVFKEIAEEEGHFIDPKNPEEISKMILEVIEGKEYKTHGNRWAFTPKNFALNTYRAYKELMPS